MADEVKLRISSEADTQGLVTYGRTFEQIFGKVKGGLDEQKKVNDAIISQLQKQIALAKDISEKNRLMGSLATSQQHRALLETGGLKGIAAAGASKVSANEHICIEICDDSLKKLASMLGGSGRGGGRKFQFGEEEPGMPGGKGGGEGGDALEELAGKLTGFAKFLASPEGLALTIAGAIGKHIVSEAAGGYRANLSHGETIQNIAARENAYGEARVRFSNQLKALGDGLGYSRDEMLQVYSDLADATGKSIDVKDKETMVNESALMARGLGLSPQELAATQTAAARSGVTIGERGKEDYVNFHKAMVAALNDPKVLTSHKEMNSVLARTFETQLGSFRGVTTETAVGIAAQMNKSGLAGLRGEQGADVLQRASDAIAQGGGAGEAGQAFMYQQIKRRAEKKGINLTIPEMETLLQEGAEGSGEGLALMYERLNKEAAMQHRKPVMNADQIKKFHSLGTETNLQAILEGLEDNKAFGGAGGDTFRLLAAKKMLGLRTTGEAGGLFAAGVGKPTTYGDEGITRANKQANEELSDTFTRHTVELTNVKNAWEDNTEASQKYWMSLKTMTQGFEAAALNKESALEGGGPHTAPVTPSYWNPEVSRSTPAPKQVIRSESKVRLDVHVNGEYQKSLDIAPEPTDHQLPGSIH